MVICKCILTGHAGFVIDDFDRGFDIMEQFEFNSFLPGDVFIMKENTWKK